MLFKFHSNFLELCVNLEHGFGHLVEMHGSANACDRVFAMSIYEIVATEDLFAGTRVPRETTNAGSRALARIADTLCTTFTAAPSKPVHFSTRRQVTAFSAIQEPKTVAMAPQSCSKGSSRKSLPAFSRK